MQRRRSGLRAGRRLPALNYLSAFLVLLAAQIGWWQLLGVGLSGNPGRVIGFPAWYFFGPLSGAVFFSIASAVVFRYVRRIRGD